MNRAKWLAFAVGAMAFAVPGTADAQRVDHPWLLEVYGAHVPTAGDYRDVVKNGWALGGLIGYEVMPRWYVMGNLNVAWFTPEDEVDGFDWTDINYFGMLGFDVTKPVSRADVLVVLGAGGVTFEPRVDGLEERTYFALNGGVKIHYYLSPRAAGTIDVMAALAFSDADFVGRNTWFFPLSLGVAFRL